MKISINIPSYKKEIVKTLKFLPSAKVWIDESEFEKYQRNNKGVNLISVKSGIQGNLCRIRNYIIDQEFKNGADVVLLLDDDLNGLYQYRFKNGFAYNRHKLDEDEIYQLLEKYSILCDDFGFKFWGVNPIAMPLAFRYFSPFSTVAYIGGPFQCILKGNDLRYDEKLHLKEDYDYTLQNLNKYRGALRVNSIFYECDQNESRGGCAVVRNIEKEKEQFLLLQNKWGGKIIKKDITTKKSYDINPIMKSPIKGI